MSKIDTLMAVIHYIMAENNIEDIKFFIPGVLVFKMNSDKPANNASANFSIADSFKRLLSSHREVRDSCSVFLSDDYSMQKVVVTYEKGIMCEGDYLDVFAQPIRKENAEDLLIRLGIVLDNKCKIKRMNWNLSGDESIVATIDI